MRGCAGVRDSGAVRGMWGGETQASESNRAMRASSLVSVVCLSGMLALPVFFFSCRRQMSVMTCKRCSTSTNPGNEGQQGEEREEG